MKHNRAATAEDLASLPEGEWVRFEKGIKVKWIGLEEAKAAAAVEVELSARDAKRLRALHGTKLRATLRGRTLIVKKQSARRSH